MTGGPAARGSRADAVSLLLRLGIGPIFVFAGLQKVAGGGVAAAAFFEDLGLPAPELVGPAIGFMELVGGVLLSIGAATRLLSVLFTAEMLVAIPLSRLSIAAQEGSVAGGFAAIRLEVLIIIAAICLVLLGAGRWSADAAITPRLGTRERKRSTIEG